MLPTHRTSGALLLVLLFAVLGVMPACSDDTHRSDGWKLDAGGGDAASDGATADGANPDDATTDADVDAGPPPDITPEEFYDRWQAKDTCGHLTWCDNYGDFHDEFRELTCHSDSPEFLRPEAEAASLEDGSRMDFDPWAARRCLEELEQASSCEELEDARAACSGVLTGAQDEGEPCISHMECGPDLFCETKSSCPGRCKSRLPEGAGCTEHRMCGHSLFCDFAVTHTCKPATLQEGQRCTADIQCGTGLTCCNSEELCTGARANTCVPTLGEGETCRDSEIVYLDMPCQQGLHCIDQTCQKGPGPGEPCATDLDVCAVGSHCHEGTCYELSLPGGSCEGDANCPASHFCDAGTCEELPVVGESCQASGRCYSGACVDGVCAFLAEGEECEQTTVPQCEQGHCRYDSDSGVSRCMPGSVYDTESCINEQDCERGLDCIRGTCTPACTEM